MPAAKPRRDVRTERGAGGPKWRPQVVAELGAGRGATHVDVFGAMAQLRVTISDVEADALLSGLQHSYGTRGAWHMLIVARGAMDRLH